VQRPSPSDIAAARRRLFILLAAGAVALLLLLGLPGLATLYTELRWFQSLGHAQVFTTILGTRVLLGVAVFALVALVLELNLRVALRATTGLASLHIADPGGTSRIDLGRIAPRVLRPALLVVAVLTAMVASRGWEMWLRFSHASDFGIQDPIFGSDVSFYVFRLPVLEAARSLGWWVVGLSLALCVALHIARGGLVYDGRTFTAHRRTRLHLSALVIAVFGLLAFDAWLDTRQLLFSQTGPVAGASYSDVHARLPALRILIAAAVAGAVLTAVSMGRRRLILLIAGAGLYLAVSLLGVRLYPGLTQRFSVLPNEAEKEAPFIQHNIDATRDAYGLADVDERDLKGKMELSMEDIDNNRATVENIRLWDHRPLLDTFSQIQEIRTYYDFTSVDNDRYVIGGELRQTMLSPRELSAESLPNRTWINEHFTFTHGYGLTLGPVNQATKEGLPVLYIQDIPPASSVEELRVERPAIYFGELSNDHVFVGTGAREFHYPSGDENVYKAYEGKDGIHLDSVLMRVTLALRLGSMKVLLSEEILPESRVLLHRNIRDRLETVAPFLVYDRDPYMVIRDDGRLAWIQDAYTITGRYPYAEAARPGLNYIRNSVKVVIDAYDGDVQLFVADPNDPVLRVWRRAFPTMFRPLGEMDADLRAHLRHPEDLFRIQTEMFTVYHMKDPELVYNREDQWEIPTITRTDSTQRMEPYYTVMRLPGEEQPEFIQMLPFTPKRKNNLSAWMVARTDGDRRGELVVYRFPRDRLVFGPRQVMNRISQEADISRQISLWDQRGSQAILGTLLVIPIERSLIYVCPLYLRSQGGTIPELKRVIVAHGNRIAMEPTLDEALEAVFRGTRRSAEEDVELAPEDLAEAPADQPSDRPADRPAPADTAAAPEPADARASIQRARDRFDEANEALRRGDWAAYGRKMDEVRTLLERLAEGSP
jgi:uncharacterized protein